jgi:hypothetical protein
MVNTNKIMIKGNGDYGNKFNVNYKTKSDIEKVLYLNYPAGVMISIYNNKNIKIGEYGFGNGYIKNKKGIYIGSITKFGLKSSLKFKNRSRKLNNIIKSDIKENFKTANGILYNKW